MSVNQVIILVPTAGRPGLLRTALESIATQTEVARITRVIISENAGDLASRAVSAEFSDRLPVDYIFRESPLPPIEHALVLTDALPSQGFVGILHDDDWWSPTHLANSLDRLDKNPAAVASYSSFFEVSGENSLLKSDSNLMFWFGANFPALGYNWQLDEPAVLLSCLWGTPGRYSTLFARIPNYRQAASITYREGNPFDNDRRLLIELARSGSVVFDPMPSVFIRIHGQQDTFTFDWAEQNRHLKTTTQYLITRVRDLSLKLDAEIAGRLHSCPRDARPTLLSALSRACCAEVLVERGVAPPELNAYYASFNVQPNWRYYMGRLLPPLLLSAITRRRRTRSAFDE